jgi:Protein of unknown function (DUF2924)
MSRGTIDDAALEAEIGQLPALSLLELRNRWKTLFGHPAPRSLRRNFLARAVAYQMQVEAYGGLSVATKRRLREIANAVRNGDGNAMLGSSRIKPGTQMIRQWQNTTHTVTALVDGFEWNGRTYKSLRRCQCHHRYQLERVCFLWHQASAIWQQERVGTAANQRMCKSRR